MFVSMLEDANFDRYHLSSLRTGIMAGAPCPAPVMQKVMDDMHMPQITIAYGMTETSPVSFQSSIDDPFAKRVHTVGRVHPMLAVKIVDQHGQIAALGEAGELCTRGYSVMRGYWDDVDRTAESIDADGWMHTGDLATLDEEGYCSIVGRLKDMIIRGGENIYPAEIEALLFRHPAVHNVQVFGVSDDKYGEAVAAWLVLKPEAVLDEAALREYCREHMAHYKVPEHIRFVKEIPMTVTGKPQKFVMREQMQQQLRC